MAAFVIPESLQTYIPQTIAPERLWVHHDPRSDSVVIYFTGEPVPTVWDPIDDYLSLGFSEDETVATGVMIEHFSGWLFHDLRLATTNGHP